MNRVFIDMDGVIVDFNKFRDERGLTGDQVKVMPGAYLQMPAISGAIDAVRSLIGMGYEVWLATKPPTGVAHAYSDKAAWVFAHLPELKRRLIVTHDKGLLGDEGDFLCDDRPHKANCEAFPGRLLRFVDGFHWPEALAALRRNSRQSGGSVTQSRQDAARWRAVRQMDGATISSLLGPRDGRCLESADAAVDAYISASNAGLTETGNG